MQIKHRFTGVVLFELKTQSIRLCVEAAVKSGANLQGADLRGANLQGADLRGTNLQGADLRGADLQGNKIRGAVGLIQAGIPNDGQAYGFVDDETDALWVWVGCRVKEINDGRAYWSLPDHSHREDRCEVLAALDYIEAVAKLRGWEPSK